MVQGDNEVFNFGVYVQWSLCSQVESMFNRLSLLLSLCSTMESMFSGQVNGRIEQDVRTDIIYYISGTIFITFIYSGKNQDFFPIFSSLERRT